MEFVPGPKLQTSFEEILYIISMEQIKITLMKNKSFYTLQFNKYYKIIP